MKIPKLFKKAAAFVMAAVTALSIMPATAFAAGDIGTISFSHTYDSNGNAMRYNSSANIGGYTAGGTGNYKYNPYSLVAGAGLSAHLSWEQGAASSPPSSAP